MTTEYNVRIWKTEAGWKVTTTAINGKSRDVASKLREDVSVAVGIAQQFLADMAAQEWRRVGDVLKEDDLFKQLENSKDTAGDGIPEEGLPADPEQEDTTPDHIVDAINASMLAGDKKRGFRR